MACGCNRNNGGAAPSGGVSNTKTMQTVAANGKDRSKKIRKRGRGKKKK